jgi:hypothetical protein
MLKRLGTQRLVALFSGALMALNYPLLALWNLDTTVAGLPLFPLALFGLWTVLIALLAWLLEHGDD